MFTYIRILSFVGIFAPSLFYLIKSRMDGATINRLFNVINLVIRWGIVFAASMFSPLAFRIVTGVVAGWTLFYRTGMWIVSFKSDEVRYGLFAPYFFSALVWIVLFIMSFF